MSKILTGNFGKTLYTKKQKQSVNRKTITLSEGKMFWIYETTTHKMWMLPLEFNVRADGSAFCEFKPAKNQLICVAKDLESAKAHFINIVTKLKENGKAK